MILTRAKLDELKLRTKVVRVESWGGEVMIRELTGTDRDKYEAGIFGNTIPKKGQAKELNLQNARAKLVALCLIDENGQLLYKENEVYLLGRLNAVGLDFVYDECRKLSGITDEDDKELEQAIKNSPAVQNGGSGLDLP